jgi:CheY-like chemotaxis protein
MNEPRVLVVMEAQWPRALLLAALQDAGYDTVGAPNPSAALDHPATEPSRGPIRLIVLDPHIPRDDPELLELLRRHAGATPLHLESGLQPTSPVIEQHTLRYPVSIGEVVQRVEHLLPIH